jgi:hypothetical protein
MKKDINKFTPYTNCPSGEYWATFCNSEVKKYPRGKREIISFLILNEDKKTPRLNNKGEPYYSTIICNESKGTSPKSKVSKIKNAMLTKEEYDPIDVCLGVPNFDNFNKRKMKIRVTTKGTGMNFATHIQRPRDNEWECIEGEFDGTINNNSDPIEVFKSMKQTINKRELNYAAQAFYSVVNYYSDKNGKFIFNLNQTDKRFGNQDKIRHEQLLKFLETKDVADLQNLIGGYLVK